MGVIVTRGTKHLALDKLSINPKLARRLPPALAFRYHALPLAKERGRITVAMADPNDSTARAAVAEALGSKPYVVQGDQTAIDELLAELWPEAMCHALRLLVYHQASRLALEVQDYAHYLCELLDGHLSDFQDVMPPEGSFGDFVQEAKRGYDLVIFGEPDQSAVERLLCGPAELKASELMPCSVLITPNNAAVTVLAVVPDMPAMCSPGAYRQSNMAIWLASDTSLGRQLRQIAQRLRNWGTEGTLRFRQGAPEQQIQYEVVEGDYDLIVMAADDTSWWSRRLLGELVTPLLRGTDRPVLIAKSTDA
jgi:nucleotide-binding universal stress UspA family protein